MFGRCGETELEKFLRTEFGVLAFTNRLGRNPTALKLSLDGRKFALHQYMVYQIVDRAQSSAD